MAALRSPVHIFRGLLRELRHLHGPERYKNAAACKYIREQFRKYQMRACLSTDVKRFGEAVENVMLPVTSFSMTDLVVTSEKLCLAQQELQFQASTYFCLLQSVRNQLIFHEEFHTKGERSPEEVAGLVGLKLPQQPGGKGWET